MTKILDHGYLKHIEHYGSDERIIEAARMSTGKGFLGWEPGVCPICDGARVTTIPFDDDELGELDEPVECWACEGKGAIAGDKNLLQRLWVKKHATPFEMAGLIVEAKAPIIVFREWHRHRTQSYNEHSARYAPLPPIDYIPTVDRMMIGGGGVTKQAGTVSGSDQLTPDIAARWLAELAEFQRAGEQLYRIGLAAGVPKELARLAMTVGRYSKMRAAANLRNWLAFLTLRMAPDAQWEIRQYANAVGDLIAQYFPRTWELFRGPPERAATAATVAG